MRSFIILLCVSCGPDYAGTLRDDYNRIPMTLGGVTDPRTHHPEQPELVTYKHKFAAVFGVDVSEIPISVGDISTAGRCIVYTYTGVGMFPVTYKEIIVNRVWFEQHKDNSNALEELVFHEYGHCALGRDHDDTYIGDTYMPTSIMRSWAFNSRELRKYYIPNRQYYINELGR